MNSKIKRDALTASADVSRDDTRIVVEYTATNAADPMAELASMERYARSQLTLQPAAAAATTEVSGVLHLPKGAYVHYIPQYYLH
jgi:hypothetical protein